MFPTFYNYVEKQSQQIKMQLRCRHIASIKWLYEFTRPIQICLLLLLLLTGIALSWHKGAVRCPAGVVQWMCK